MNGHIEEQQRKHMLVERHRHIQFALAFSRGHSWRMRISEKFFNAPQFKFPPLRRKVARYALCCATKSSMRQASSSTQPSSWPEKRVSSVMRAKLGKNFSMRTTISMRLSSVELDICERKATISAIQSQNSNYEMRSDQNFVLEPAYKIIAICLRLCFLLQISGKCLSHWEGSILALLESDLFRFGTTILKKWCFSLGRLMLAEETLVEWWTEKRTRVYDKIMPTTVWIMAKIACIR